MGRIIRLPYGAELVIQRPIVLHAGDIVNREELIAAIQCMVAVNPKSGIYVYQNGYDYPSSTGFTWHLCDKTLRYLLRIPDDIFEVKFTPTGWYAEKAVPHKPAITKEYVLNNTLWIVKYNGQREVVTGKQLQKRWQEYAHDANIRDIDLSAEQPAELQGFVDTYLAQDRILGYHTYVEKYFNQRKEDVKCSS